MQHVRYVDIPKRLFRYRISLSILITELAMLAMDSAAIRHFERKISSILAFLSQSERSSPGLHIPTIVQSSK